MITFFAQIMKLRIASLALLIQATFAQEPWSIGAGTVQINSNGDSLNVRHILGDSPGGAKVRLFDKGCQTELSGNEIVTITSQTFTSISSAPSAVQTSHPTSSFVPSISPTESPTSIGLKMLAPDGAAGDWFGHGISILGSTIALGPYIFDTTGHFVRKLVAPDGAVDDGFGWSVSISGSTIVIGAWFDDDNGADSGSAYIFNTSGQFQKKLLAPDGVSLDYFGENVSVSGSTIVIGAKFTDTCGRNCGAAYIFDTTGQFVAKLVAPDPSIDTWFGNAVGVSGSTVVVGAYYDDAQGTDSGSAYIFDTTGQFIKKIQAPDGQAGDLFSRTLAISGSTIVITSIGDDDHGSGSGAAHIFDTAGQYVKKLVAPDATAGLNFGSKVAVSESLIVISAVHGGCCSESGSVYVFDITGQFVKKLVAPDAAAGDWFDSVAVDGTTIVVGAYKDDDNGTDSGSAYLFL